MRSLKVVEIELGPNIEIRPVLAGRNGGRSEMFSDMVKRLKPYAAINGTFYSQDMLPLGDVLVDGKLLIRGRYPNAIAIGKNGRIEFIRRSSDRFDWSNYKCALAAGPRLVHKGVVGVDPKADGFLRLDKESLAPRSGIGLTKSGRLLLVVSTEPVNIVDFAQAMKKAGAVEAMNLDGGPASGLYYDGKLLVKANLRMTNLLVIYKR